MPLCLAVLLAWALSGALGLRWSRPLSFGGDHLFLLLHGRLFLDWPDILRNPHLGFPGAIDLLAFPFTDLTQRVVQAAATLATGSVMRGAYLYVMATIAANTAAAYLALVVFTGRGWHAVTGSVAFALLPFFISRIGGHDYLAAYHAAPLAFVLLHRVARAAGPGALARDPVAWSCVAVIATSGFYFSLFALMLLGFGGVALAVLRRSVRPLLPALAAAGAVSVLLGVVLLAFVLHAMDMRAAGQGDPFPPRAFHEQILYGTRIADTLRLADAVATPAMQQYGAWAGQREGTDFWPGPLLSIFALCACLLGPLVLARRRGAALPAGRHEITSVLVAWLIFCLLFSVPYGLGMVMNVLVSPVLRAQNRIAPFFAMAAMLLAIWAWRIPTAWIVARAGPARGAALAAIGLAALAALNAAQGMGGLARRQAHFLGSPDYHAEIASLDRVLAMAQESGAIRILQLPIVSWPEQPPIGGFDPYWHLRPYIRSAPGSPFRWSYGMTMGAPEFLELRAIGGLPDRAAATRRIACLGFDAVLLERRAFAPDQVAAWDAALQGSGAPMIHGDDRRRLYRLPPVAGTCG